MKIIGALRMPPALVCVHLHMADVCTCGSGLHVLVSLNACAVVMCRISWRRKHAPLHFLRFPMAAPVTMAPIEAASFAPYQKAAKRMHIDVAIWC